MTGPITILTSIDTEEDNWDPTREKITVENIRELPRLDRLFERIGIRATYFTTHRVGRTPWCMEILRGLADTGRSEIGSHLHPWNTPPVTLELTPHNTMLGNLPEELQRAKVKTLTDLLAAGLAERPYTFRAGRWAFTGATARTLIATGYRVDSSVTPFRSWTADEGTSHLGAPLNVYRLDGRGDHRVPVPDGALVEVPLSWGYTHGAWNALTAVDRVVTRPLFHRVGLEALVKMMHLVNHVVLSPEVEELDDMERLAWRLIERGARHLHLTFHSPSLVPGLSPFASTTREVDALYARIAGLVERVSARVPVRFATVGEGGALLAPARVPGSSTPLPPEHA